VTVVRMVVAVIRAYGRSPPGLYRVASLTVELLVAMAAVVVESSVAVLVMAPVVRSAPAMPAELLAPVAVPPGGKATGAVGARVTGPVAWPPKAAPVTVQPGGAALTPPGDSDTAMAAIRAVNRTNDSSLDPRPSVGMVPPLPYAPVRPRMIG
jgi:hypothetical protein